MSTTIEWTQRPGTKGETWNPTTGCNKVSPGCKHCYAEVMHRRLHAMGVKGYERPFLDGAVPQPHRLRLPLKWKAPRTVFVNSMSDLFHADVPFAFIDQVFAVMALTPQHTYQILTKRPERMAEYLGSPDVYSRVRAIVDGPSDVRDAWFKTMDRFQKEERQKQWWTDLRKEKWPLPNVWLGTSVEDQATADARIPHLLKCPAAVRFLSCEPLLGAVDLTSVDGVPYGGPEGHRIDCIRKGYWSKRWGFVNHSDLHDTFGPLHWVIAGGESGPKARPMHPDWARGLRDQCKAAGVPFFFKQWGEWLPAGQGKAQGSRATTVHDGCEWDAVGKHNSGRLLDGEEHNGWPNT